MAAKKLLSVNDILDAITDTYRAHWQELMAFAAVYQAVSFLFGAQGLGLLVSKEESLARLILNIVKFLSTMYVEAALFHFILNLGSKNKVSQSFKAAYSAALPFAWLMILVGLADLAGFILLVIPGFIFFTWFSLAPVLFFAEGARGRRAMGASKSLVSGHSWGVFGRLVLFIFLVQGTYFIANSALRSAGLAYLALYADLVLGVVLLPVTLLLLKILYANLKELKAA